jgi:hypothetical protein
MLSNFDPHTNQYELEVQRIIHLQGIANQLPDVFTNNKKIMKSHIPVANIPARIEIPEGKLINITANESKAHLKRRRPINAKDKNPQKRKTLENQVAAPEEAIPMAQGFSQRPSIDYEETYAPVMDAITFKIMISLVITENLDMRLMDVVTAYLYGSLDNDIYIKIPEGYRMLEVYNLKILEEYEMHEAYNLKSLKDIECLKHII